MFLGRKRFTLFALTLGESLRGEGARAGHNNNNKQQTNKLVEIQVGRERHAREIHNSQFLHYSQFFIYPGDRSLDLGRGRHALNTIIRDRRMGPVGEFLINRLRLVG